MGSVLDLITDSAVLINAVDPGAALNKSENVMAFNTLNELLDEWNTELVNLYQINDTVYVLPNTSGAYPIGPGAASPFNVARPVMVQSANILMSNGVRAPLDILSAVQFAAIEERLLSNSARPQKLYYDRAFNSGTGTLYLWPLPANGLSLELFTWQQLAQFVALTDTVSFAPGYLKALTYSLAVNIADRLGANCPPNVLAIAQSSKGVIRGLNAQYLQGAVSQSTAGQVPAVGIPMAQPQQ